MQKEIIKEAVGIAKLIDDPVLIVLVIIILSFLFFVYYTAKIQSKKDEKNLQIINNLIEEVNRNSQTLIKLTTLIEVLVHGGRKND